MDQILKQSIYNELIRVVSETNGLSLDNTLSLILSSEHIPSTTYDQFRNFQQLINSFQIGHVDIEVLLAHPVAAAFYQLFKNFPLKYREEHTHLTGALTPDFVHPRLQALLNGSQQKIYREKIDEVYHTQNVDLTSLSSIEKLIRLQEGDLFDRYLKVLLLPKLILTSREAHSAASYSMASDMYYNYNVGAIRLKFTLSRATQDSQETIPGADDLATDSVVLGLFEGFKEFQKTHPDFEFILSPCFRKEAAFFDVTRFKTKREHFEAQVADLLKLIDKNPRLAEHVTEVDTVGSEKELYRKEHFQEMKVGFRKLQSRGFKIRSHHGETWFTLRRGIQSVDNAMNIWHVDAVEHGLSLGINPNFYFQRLLQRVLCLNRTGQALSTNSSDYNELQDISWEGRHNIADKLIAGTRLTASEEVQFTKAKFHLATELEHYQHDVLNRMIDKELSVIALPSSNKKLTGQMNDYKEHPFSWWEKKGMKLGVGTDNYITLNTNYLREMLILLFTDPVDLKITKLLMVCSGEKRRPYISQLLWSMRKKALNEDNN